MSRVFFFSFSVSSCSSGWKRSHVTADLIFSRGWGIENKNRGKASEVNLPWANPPSRTCTLAHTCRHTPTHMHSHIHTNTHRLYSPGPPDWVLLNQNKHSTLTLPGYHSNTGSRMLLKYNYRQWVAWYCVILSLLLLNLHNNTDGLRNALSECSVSSQSEKEAVFSKKT